MSRDLIPRMSAGNHRQAGSNRKAISSQPHGIPMEVAIPFMRSRPSLPVAITGRVRALKRRGVVRETKRNWFMKATAAARFEMDGPTTGCCPMHAIKKEDVHPPMDFPRRVRGHAMVRYPDPVISRQETAAPHHPNPYAQGQRDRPDCV